MRASLVSPLGLDPRPASRTLSSNVVDLGSSRVMLLDNGKWNVNHMMSGIAEGLEGTLKATLRLKKPHYSRVLGPTGADGVMQAAEWVITGVAD